ncbi:MAG: hypothetical protein KF745_03150 [Phycisphaeraceae bacterium]|nr:hypothetical protein [Phycisphaeraceae bacterium]
MAYLAILGRFHLVLLHLPIGLIAGLAAVEVLAMLGLLASARPVIRVLVWLVAASAAATAATGFILSYEDGYGPGVTVHMWLGIAAAVLAVTTAVLLEVSMRRGGAGDGGGRRGYRLALLATLGVVIAAGHFGATLTHGEGFLFAPLSAAPPAPPIAGPAPEPSPPREVAPPAAREGPRFEADIQPVFASLCYRCHSDARQRGGLALHTPEAVLAGGKSGPVVVPGKPDGSEMVRRLHLPLDDDDHMPPSERPQPTAEQIRAIEEWIKAGAPVPAPRVGGGGGQ